MTGALDAIDRELPTEFRHRWKHDPWRWCTNCSRWPKARQPLGIPVKDRA